MSRPYTLQQSVGVTKQPAGDRGWTAPIAREFRRAPVTEAGRRERERFAKMLDGGQARFNRDRRV